MSGGFGGHAEQNHVARLQAVGVDVIEGPIRRFGAGGWGRSIYCRDPSGNGIELISYEPEEPDLRDADPPA